VNNFRKGSIAILSQLFTFKVKLRHLTEQQIIPVPCVTTCNKTLPFPISKSNKNRRAEKAPFEALPLQFQIPGVKTALLFFAGVSN